MRRKNENATLTRPIAKYLNLDVTLRMFGIEFREIEAAYMPAEFRR